MHHLKREKFSGDNSDLEPFIDATTMEIHAEKHHQAYLEKLEAALEGTEFAEKPLNEILANLDSIPEDKRTAVRNNGGGVANHNLFFLHLKKNENGKPTGKLLEQIESAFGDFEKFREEFSKNALSLFGSGWVFLAAEKDGTGLHIHQMPNQDSPLMHGHKPILGLDVWEHAYYLKYQNKRADYVEAFWNVVDWEQVQKNLNA